MVFHLRFKCPQQIFRPLEIIEPHYSQIIFHVRRFFDQAGDLAVFIDNRHPKTARILHRAHPGQTVLFNLIQL